VNALIQSNKIRKTAFNYQPAKIMQLSRLDKNPNYSQDTIIYQLIWQRSFIHLIYRIASLDLNEDGIEEIIVATQYFTGNLFKFYLFYKISFLAKFI